MSTVTIRDREGRFTAECGWSRQRDEWPAALPPHMSRTVVDAPMPGVVQDGRFIPMPVYHGSPSRFVRSGLGTMKAWILGQD